MGKAVARLIGFCPVCVSWQKRSVTAPFGHRLSDELSEIILDHLHFDHRLTTTVQWHYKMLEKPVVTTNNGLFLVLAVNVHNQQNSRSNASLYHSVVVLRPGRPEVRILPVAPKKHLAMYFARCFFVYSISALNQLQQHIIGCVCVLALLDFLVSQLIYGCSC